MKKIYKALLLGLLMAGPIALMAQTLHVNRSDYHQSTYTFKAPEVRINNHEIAGAMYTELVVDGSTPSTAVGKPNLPIISEMIEIPLCQNVKVEVTNVQTKVWGNLKYRMMPVQPAPSKSDRAPRSFELDADCYAQNTFYANELAWVDIMGVARDKNVAILRVSPFSYNPITGEVMQVVSMDIDITFEGADVQATQQMHQRYYSPDFALGTRLLSQLPCSKEIRRAAPLHYLIVAHSSFRGQLDEFVAWKKRQGFIVTVGYTDDDNVGTTTTSIAAYTKSFYTNATAELPAPTYLLLVGDVAQIPAFNAQCVQPSTDHVTDLYYVTWTTGDNIPDCYQGRFSARTVAELMPQINKTIFYEGYNFTDDSYLSRGILIAGEDGGYTSDNAYRYSDPTMDYVAKYYINAANGFETVHYYKNNTSFAPNGVTVDGSCSSTSTANTLRNYYNQGYGWVNYSAHGYDNEWSTPKFNADQASAMTNRDMPGIMIGNCCLSGKFNTRAFDQCLGEALLRKGNNAGAVAYFGGTNSTYWPHDFSWSVGVRTNISGTMDATYDAQHLGMYDRLFHTHNEANSAWHNTCGAMNVAGNTAVEEYGSYARYYWEIYELFGDPSLMPWLGIASDMNVTAGAVIPVGSSTYTVSAAPYAYVALTTAGEHDFVAAVYANGNGEAVFNLPSDLIPGDYELSVWAQNYKPYFQNVTVSVLDGPYMVVVDMQPATQLRPGQVSNFDVKLSNMGNAAVAVGSVSFASQDALANVVNTTAWFQNCAAGDTITLSGVCPVYVSDQAVNGTSIRITASIDYGGDLPSAKTKAFSVQASELVIVNQAATPSLIPATSSTISCTLENRGSMATSNLTFTLENTFGIYTVNTPGVNVGVINAGEQATITFGITMSEQAPLATIPFQLYASDGVNTYYVGTLNFRCGQATIEDFESNSFNTFAWTMNDNAWEITSSGTYAGAFSARSTTNLGDRQESKMTISWTSAIDDSISFYYKVSSESGYDKFTFQINGNQVLEASGEEDWQHFSYPVSAGTNVFDFSYAKDYSMSRGSDCAWVDNISLPFFGDVCTFTTDTACQNFDYTFFGETVETDQLGNVQYINQTDEINYLDLTVMPAPQVSIEVINCGGCFLLKAHGATTYEWSTGERGNAIAVCPTERATYSVIGTRGGCTGEASTSLLDITNITAETAVALYPNPAHDRVVVAAEGIRSVQLINLMGQVLHTTRATSSTVALDLQHVPAGVYFVRVETANGRVVKKLVRK